MVTFADPTAPVTTATFAEAGDYVLRVVAANGAATAESTLDGEGRAAAAGDAVHARLHDQLRHHEPHVVIAHESDHHALDSALHRSV